MISIKNHNQIDKMRSAGHLLYDTLQFVKEKVQPGISTYELDRYAEEFIRAGGGIPSFKGYEGYPAALCTSVDEQVVHGIPSKTCILKEGSIISLDCGVVLDGWQSDSALTVPVGKVSDKLLKLIRDTEYSFFLGAMQAKVGNKLGDIGRAIQNYCEERGYGVIRDLTGHGIGRDVHEDPMIPNYFGAPNKGLSLKPGMTVAIEPMVSLGSWRVNVLDDGWTVITRDQSPSAHYEHTMAVGNEEPELLSYPGFSWEKFKESMVLEH